MTDAPVDHIVKCRGVHEPVDFTVKPDAETRAVIARDLGIPGIRKLTFTGQLLPDGNRDLRLEAKLGATVVQDCVVTGEPVTTRIDEATHRHYLSHIPEPTEGEVEMPHDENSDPLPDALDLVAVMTEALALALPDWPRALGVDPVDVTVTEPGKAPMTDDDAKPFAALKTLRETGSGDGST
ncbi:DUF177 domain-containing protein [Rhodobacteraceae bacterium]|nr:DUF177 domain-containing protein [Paracoccaceae bacterium]